MFGCTSTGMNSFICGCPQGYQRVGQGHCVSTISPLAGPGIGQDVGHVPIFPIEPDQKLDSKIFSGEGCFTCKVRIEDINQYGSYIFFNFR